MFCIYKGCIQIQKMTAVSKLIYHKKRCLSAPLQTSKYDVAPPLKNDLVPHLQFQMALLYKKQQKNFNSTITKKHGATFTKRNDQSFTKSSKLTSAPPLQKDMAPLLQKDKIHSLLFDDQLPISGLWHFCRLCPCF